MLGIQQLFLAVSLSFVDAPLLFATLRRIMRSEIPNDFVRMLGFDFELLKTLCREVVQIFGDDHLRSVTNSSGQHTAVIFIGKDKVPEGKYRSTRIQPKYAAKPDRRRRLQPA